MPNAQELRRLGPPVVRTAWLFQAIIAGIAFVYLGPASLWIVHRDYFMPFTIYQALKDFFLALLAAMIIFIVIVQRNYPDPHPTVTARFELSKGVLATAVWAWVLLDAIFSNPCEHYDPCQRNRRTRLILAAASAVILLLFFYPTMFYSARLAREAEQEAGEANEHQEAVIQDTEATEEQPLLQV